MRKYLHVISLAAILAGLASFAGWATTTNTVTGSCPTSQWVNAVNVQSIPQSCAQPTYSDLSAPNVALTKPANPSAVTPGTGTAQMLGLAANANPSVLTTSANGGGRVHYSFDFSVLIASTANGATFQCSHGTGTAPANAASVTGTQDSSALAFLAGATTEKAVIHCEGTLTGLAASTAVWFDVAVLNTTGSQAVTVTVPTFNAFEF